MLIVFLVIMCAVFGVVVYAVFASGLLSGGDGGGSREGATPGGSGSYGYGFGYDLKPPRLRELSPGCLISIIVVASIWFIAWGIVLLVAIKLLRTPLD